MAKSSSGKPKPATKSEVLSALAEHAKLTKKDVQTVLDGLGELIKKNLGKKGPGVFVVPGLVRMKMVHKPATKARVGRNPRTGEEITIKAKPARNVVRASPLKALKDTLK